jgi:hypothetical protein
MKRPDAARSAAPRAQTSWAAAEFLRPIASSLRPPKRRRYCRRLAVEELEQRVLLAQSAGSLVLLDPAGRDALAASGNALIKVVGASGSIQVNSVNVEDAVANGNAQVSAANILVHGVPGAVTTGQGAFTGTITPGAPVVVDPLAKLVAPTPPVKAFPPAVLTGSGPYTLTPGNYLGGIQIAGKAAVTMQPGVYFILSGGFSVSGQATVVTGATPSADTGAGVLIYNVGTKTSDAVTISGQASVKLTAPTLGTYRGISIFEARTSKTPITISGGGATLAGTIYAPTVPVMVTGDGVLTLGTAPVSTIASELIADDLQVSGNGVVTDKVKLRPTVSVTDAGGTYNGQPYPATATVAGVSGPPGSTLENVGLALDYQLLGGSGQIVKDLGAGAPSAVGAYQVTAIFPGSANYQAASATTTFTISQAKPVVKVTDAGGTANGQPFPATATVAGVVPGVDTTPAATLEGVGITLAYYAGSSATGTPLPGAPSSPGTYTALAVFPGSADYTGASAQTTFVISSTLLPKPTVNVTDSGGTYNGQPFPATATVAGTNGQPGTSLEGVGLTLDYQQLNKNGQAIQDLGSTAPTSADSYQVIASFPGSTGYQAASATAPFTITPATPTVKATDAGGTANGQPFPATASVAGVVVGVDDAPATMLEGVGLTLTYYTGSDTSGTLLSGAPSSPGTYTVQAVFPGSTDYKTASAQTTFVISVLTLPKPTVNVTDAGGTYNGQPFPATATVAGTNGQPGSTLEGVGLTLDYQQLDSMGQMIKDLGATAPSAAGSYQVTASFPGSTDYQAASATTPFTISQKAASVTPAASGKVYGSADPALTSTLSGFVASDNVTATYSRTAGETVLGGPYTISALLGPTSVLGNYNITYNTAVFTITPATPTVKVTDAGGTANGQPFPATATVAGVIPGVDATPAATLEGIGLTLTYYAGSTPSGTPLSGAPSAPGTYTVQAVFPGSADYKSTNNQTTFVISAATGNFPNSPGFWVAGQDGGSPSGQGSAVVTSTRATLTEGDSLDVWLEHTFTVPATPSTLSFTIDTPTFDVPDHNAPNDAFEAALLATDGTSLVQTFAPDRDTFFNLTAGQPTALGAEATFDGHTVTLNLAGLLPGTQATIHFRVVNNDGPGTSFVHLTSFQIQSTPNATAVDAVPAVQAGRSTRPIDFTSLSDVSASFTPEYGQTSVDRATDLFYADLALRNTGTYSVGTPLIVAIAHLSDPSVHVSGADGTTCHTLTSAAPRATTNYRPARRLGRGHCHFSTPSWCRLPTTSWSWATSTARRPSRARRTPRPSWARATSTPRPRATRMATR